MSSKPVVGYWDIRGLADYVRLLLAYAGVDFEDKRYQYGDPASLATLRGEWLKDKFNLGLDFPNLPYYIDGDVKLTQSNAILRYLGAKYGLAPCSPVDLARAELALEQANDMYKMVTEVAYADFRLKMSNPSAEPQYPKLRAGLVASFPEKLAEFEKFLASGPGPFVTGGKLSYADFRVYEALDAFRIFEPSWLDSCPAVKKFLNDFEALPAIKAYQSRPEYSRLPLFGAPASDFNKKK